MGGRHEFVKQPSQGTWGYKLCTVPVWTVLLDLIISGVLFHSVCGVESHCIAQAGLELSILPSQNLRDGLINVHHQS